MLVSPILEPVADPDLNPMPVEVFVGPVRVSRATATYAVHAYHTKVPVDAIRPYIAHYTRPGDTVLDAFAGSGMTGLAAALEGRRAILNDLSPAAVHIARNYTTPCDPSALAMAADRVFSQAGPFIDALYEVSCPTCGGSATTEYVVWSDVRTCPACGHGVSVWDAREEGGVRDLTCPRCATAFDKTKSQIAGEYAASVNLSCHQCRSRTAIDPRPEDLALASGPSSIPDWYPDLPFDSTWDMWRGGHRDLGVSRVADFWSRRNLAALAALWAAINRETDDRLRDALRFAFTGIVNRASRRYQWNAKRPTNVLGGTLYIASLRYEFNVRSLFRRKLRAALAFYREVQIPAGAVEVRLGSATDLSGIADGSVSYCFTDPPFGANIYYADASLLWEAWLGTLTDRTAEAVVSAKRDGKSVVDYREIMAQSMAEIRRCLKPDGIMTMVFQNTNDAVWQALRDGAQDAGLHILGATTLHKAQPSFKGVKAAQSAERVAATDVVMTMSSDRRDRRAGTAPLEPDAVVRQAFQQEASLGGGERLRSTAHLYAVAVSALMNAGLDASGWTFERVAEMQAEIQTVDEPEQLALGIGS
jgi:DNA modification methylase